ncbi:MarR family transcriptional regulator [Erwinia sp. HR93]|uniref:MarR family transcriptional regulator n=1 Tax=Erwinia sp. HR93 TaxID=3094840 RepID=UPI002ADEA779|nr:MarR family transcriptional regulator [Erwinia sp. HR93]MEA1065026.1 MarR family transcriptional regulator [Erwinia sp. HR93]
MHSDSSDLFNQLIPLGRLIFMVNQFKDRLLNDYLSPLDVTPPQFKVLSAIRCENGITPAELRKRLSVDPGALTRMFERLHCKGWITRQPNPLDGRGFLIMLTPEGADLCKRCHELIGQDLHRELTKNLTAVEVAQLEGLLKKVLP